MEQFISALPVWSEGEEKTMHIRLLLEGEFELAAGQKAELRVATSGSYQVIINGQFAAAGPARAGRGKFRCDRPDITALTHEGKNSVVIDVCGYNANSYCMIMQDSFVQAEVFVNGAALLASGRNFSARRHPAYLRKSPRYSFQRPMQESYDLTAPKNEQVRLAVCSPKTIIERIAPYPQYEKLTAKPRFCGVTRPEKPQEYKLSYCITDIGKTMFGFKQDELEVCPVKDIQDYKFILSDRPMSGELEAGGFADYEFDYLATGFITLDCAVSEKTSLYIIFDEVLDENGQVAAARMNTNNAFRFDLPKGRHSLRFFEPYSMKYIRVFSLAACSVEPPVLIEYKHPAVRPLPFRLAPEYERIYDAAVETFRQNSVDLFTDCPSRERAGWLCDSFFTARTAFALTGSTALEKSFLTNFLHEDNYVNLPVGMLPMCYPADHTDGNYISNWAMWLVYQLPEYLTRSGDRELIDAYKSKVYGLLDFFKDFENSDGLLEKLESWVFVEWSEANNLVQDVNYPTNMLYGAMLKAAGALYGDKSLVEKGEKVLKTAAEQSFDGHFFRDHATRGRGGRLTVQPQTTEVCQYYAFFFGAADKTSHAELFDILVRDFGPDRKQTQKYPDVYFANAFVGNYLRLELLMQAGYEKEVAENIRGYFLYMADRTGTLWENDGAYASCCHGFASYVACWIERLRKYTEK